MAEPEKLTLAQALDPNNRYRVNIKYSGVASIVVSAMSAAEAVERAEKQFTREIDSLGLDITGNCKIEEQNVLKWKPRKK